MPLAAVIATAVSQHMRVNGKSNFASCPALATIRWIERSDRGAPSSLTNTNGWSGFSLRSARSSGVSSPGGCTIYRSSYGWCEFDKINRMPAQPQPLSLTRSPWRYISRIRARSRCEYRPFCQRLWGGRLTSSDRRYSRARTSSFFSFVGGISQTLPKKTLIVMRQAKPCYKKIATNPWKRNISVAFGSYFFSKNCDTPVQAR